MNSRLTIKAHILIATLLSCCAAHASNQLAESDPRWSQADALENSGQHTEAVALFQSLFDDFPDSQRAALRVAINQEKAGESADALASYASADAVDPTGYWAEVGLYYQALLRRSQGDRAGARACVAKLRTRFPDSRWTARADMLDAEIQNQAVATAQAKLDREMVAWDRMNTANAKKGRDFDDQRITKLNAVIQEFSDTRISLQALDTKGHLLIRNERFAEAIPVFEQIVTRAGADAPQSRAVLAAKSRLAGLYHATGRLDDAFNEFDALVANSSDSSTVANATLQRAGIAFERLQRRHASSDVITRAEWKELRDQCAAVHASPDASRHQRARAALMDLESFQWQGRPFSAIKGARAFLAEYAEGEFKDERAVARLVLGECLQRTGNHAEALLEYRAIAADFGDREIWPGLANTQRTYYRIYDALVRSDASDAERAGAAKYFLDRWPDSPYAHLVGSRSQEAE